MTPACIIELTFTPALRVCSRTQPRDRFDSPLVYSVDTEWQLAVETRSIDIVNSPSLRTTASSFASLCSNDDAPQGGRANQQRAKRA